MNKTIGATFEWSEEQVEAYARAFRAGDAVRAGDEWAKVKISENGIAVESELKSSDNKYRLNYILRRGRHKQRIGGAKGFDSAQPKPYEVITPKDYEVQEGDKLVWLGYTTKRHDGMFTFGRYYEVKLDNGQLAVRDDFNRSVNTTGLEWSEWSVIPRYENIVGVDDFIERVLEYISSKTSKREFNEWLEGELKTAVKVRTDTEDYEGAAEGIQLLRELNKRWCR